MYAFNNEWNYKHPLTNPQVICHIFTQDYYQTLGEKWVLTRIQYRRCGKVHVYNDNAGKGSASPGSVLFRKHSTHPAMRVLGSYIYFPLNTPQLPSQSSCTVTGGMKLKNVWPCLQGNSRALTWSLSSEGDSTVPVFLAISPGAITIILWLLEDLIDIIWNIWRRHCALNIMHNVTMHNTAHPTVKQYVFMCIQCIISTALNYWILIYNLKVT
jgi:hypothetical protein